MVTNQNKNANGKDIGKDIFITSPKKGSANFEMGSLILAPFFIKANKYKPFLR